MKCWNGIDISHPSRWSRGSRKAQGGKKKTNRFRCHCNQALARYETYIYVYYIRNVTV